MKNTTQQEADLFEKNVKRLEEIDKRLKQLNEKEKRSEGDNQEINDLVNEQKGIHKWFIDTE